MARVLKFRLKLAVRHRDVIKIHNRYRFFIYFLLIRCSGCVYDNENCYYIIEYALLMC